MVYKFMRDTDEHSNPTNAHEILVLVIWDDKTTALKKEACFAVCFRTQGERRVDSPFFLQLHVFSQPQD